MAHVRLERLSKQFSGVPILENLNFEINDGDFTVIVGPSGCGKSTLLRVIAGLEDPSSGDIYIDGERVTTLAPARRGVAMVFQSYALYPHMTVFKNIAFGLEVAKFTKAEIDTRVRHAARVLQLENFLDRKPKELSGGQRQRVAIGRAIVRDPKVFLFDEPLSNLDASLRVKMRLELAKLHRDLNATTIYVTHDQVEAMTLASNIIVLRDGRVEQVGSPMALYRAPANRFVASFIGSPSMNFVEVELLDVDPDRALVRLPSRQTLSVPVRADSAPLGARLTLGIRPEHVGDDQIEGPNVLRVDGDVFAVERLGGETFLYLHVGAADPLVVQAAGNTRARMGDRVPVFITGEDCHLFGPDDIAFPRTTSD